MGSYLVNKSVTERTTNLLAKRKSPRAGCRHGAEHNGGAAAVQWKSLAGIRPLPYSVGPMSPFLRQGLRPRG
jgi:hypothetical protein